MNTNPIKLKLAKQYAELLKSLFDENLVSVFLFGSVARGDDTKHSDIDIMAILNKPPTYSELKKLGKTGRFNEIRGQGKFKEISCAVVLKDRYLALIRERAPREAVNPLREAVVFYDKGFISGLKEKLESGAISLKEDAYVDYLRYGDIRRSCLKESIVEKNVRNARSDAAKAASHYLRAYFLRRYGEMILAKEMLMTRIKEENQAIANLYEKIMRGDYNAELVEKIREWVIKNSSPAERRL